MTEHKCTDPNCNHHHEDIKGADEKKSEHGLKRRDFIKYAGISAVGLGLVPAISYWLQDEDKIREIVKNPALANGKAQRFTILHTSDIHGQLDIHDEFFFENG